MKKTRSYKKRRGVKKATIPEISSFDELSPLGQELFRLMEQIPANQRLTARHIQQEIARLRGAIVDADMDEFVSAMEALAEEDAKPLPQGFNRQNIYFPEE